MLSNLSRGLQALLYSLLGVLVVSGFISAMIGQRNDGPWGSLPEWLGAASWYVFLASAFALVAAVVYLSVVTFGRRRPRV